MFNLYDDACSQFQGQIVALSEENCVVLLLVLGFKKHLQHIMFLLIISSLLSVIYIPHAVQITQRRTINELSGLAATCIVYERVCVFNLEREILSPSSQLMLL